MLCQRTDKRYRCAQITKKTVLEARDTLKRGAQLIPVFFGCTFFVLIFFMVYKGAPGLTLQKQSTGI